MSAPSSLWLVWRPHERVTDNVACTGAGTVRLFRNEVDAERARRTALLDDFYTAADQHYKSDADREPGRWIKTECGVWRLADAATFREEQICELLTPNGVDHSHDSIVVEKVDGLAAAASQQQLFVGVTVACCQFGESGCSSDGPKFKVSADKSAVKEWLDGELVEQLELVVSELDDAFYDKYFARNPNWTEGKIRVTECDAEAEFMRFSRIAHKADGHVCPFWWDVQIVTVDASQSDSGAKSDCGSATTKTAPSASSAAAAAAAPTTAASTAAPTASTAAVSAAGASIVSSIGAGMKKASKKPTADDSVWLLWNAGEDGDERVCSSEPCSGGTVHLYSREEDALATKRAMLLPEYYDTADVIYESCEDERDPDMWRKNKKTGEWKLRDEASIDTSDLDDLLAMGNGLAHVTMLCEKLTIDRSFPKSAASDSAAAATTAAASSSSSSSASPTGDALDAAASKLIKRKRPAGCKLWVQWTVECCPVDAVHDPQFTVFEHEAAAKVHLDQLLRDYISSEVDDLDHADAEEFAGANTNWEHFELNPDADAAAELTRMKAFKVAKNMTPRSFTFGITAVIVDAQVAEEAEDKVSAPSKTKKSKRTKA